MSKKPVKINADALRNFIERQERDGVDPKYIVDEIKDFCCGIWGINLSDNAIVLIDNSDY